MADEFAIVEFQTPTTTGTVEVSSGDITDWDAAILYITGATADATDEANAILGAALITSSASYSVVNKFRDGASPASSSNSRHYQSTKPLIIPDPVGLTTTLVEADVDSTSTDGFTLDFTKVDATNAYRCCAILFGGVSGASLNLDGVTTSLGTQNGPNFEPDLLVTLPGKGSFGSSPATVTVDSMVGSLGFVTATGQMALHGERPFGGTSTVNAVLRTTRGAGTVDGGTENQITYALTSTGYTYQADTTGVPVAVLALKFSDNRAALVDVETSSASASVQSFEGAGVTPILVLAESSRLSASNSVESGSDATTYGLHAFTDTDAISASTRAEEGVVTSAASTRIESGVPYLVLADDGTIAARASLDSFDASGFNLDFSTAGEATRFISLVIQRSSLIARVDETLDVSEDVTPIKGLPARTIDEGVDVEEQTLPMLGIPAPGLIQDNPATRLAVSQAGLIKGRIASPTSEYREN